MDQRVLLRHLQLPLLTMALPLNTSTQNALLVSIVPNQAYSLIVIAMDRLAKV